MTQIRNKGGRGKSYGHGKRGYDRIYQGTEYLDNKGHAYPFAWVAKVASFFNIFEGCLHNGFPVCVKYLWYEAWAFWPFFFFRKEIAGPDPVPVLNHERIHCRQQWDIHVTISLPLVIFIAIMEVCGHKEYMWLLPIIPFIPQIFYGISMLRALIELAIRGRRITLTSVREETCFERESNMHQMNAEYLHTRTFWAVMKYSVFALIGR